MSAFPSSEFFIPQPNRFGLHGTALAAFFARSTTTPRRLQSVTGFLEELLTVYLQTSRSESPLHTVTLAAPLATYGIREKCDQALDEARSAHDLAIGHLQVDLASDSSSSPVEGTILSVFLCLWYEVSVKQSLELHFHRMLLTVLSSSCVSKKIGSSTTFTRKALAVFCNPAIRISSKVLRQEAVSL